MFIFRGQESRKLFVVVTIVLKFWFIVILVPLYLLVVRGDHSLLTSQYYKIPYMSRNFGCIRVVPCTNCNLFTITVLVQN